MRKVTTLVFIILINGLPEALAQPASAFVYQGRLEQSGAPGQGPYDFQFELFNAADFATGISLTGPLLVLDHVVASGEFAVPIDFGMDVFGSENVWLEVRVRDGASTGAFTVLEPRQQIFAVPLAIHALNVATGVVGGAQIADGSVGAADLAPGSVTSAAVDLSSVQLRVSQGCNVGSAVRAINADGSVVCQTGNVGDVTQVVAGAGLVGGATTGSAQLDVDYSQVQARLLAGCPGGQLLTGIDATGMPQCSPLPIPSTTSVISDPAGSVGADNRIMIGSDGLPVIGFYSMSPAGVVVVKCNDIACFGGDETETFLDADAGQSGLDMTLGSTGFPILAYAHTSTNTVRVASCNDHACSGGDELISNVFTAPFNGIFSISIAVDGSGLPLLSFHATATLFQGLQVVLCNDADCSGNDEVANEVRADLGFPESKSIALFGSDGLPLIIYDVALPALAIEAAKCNDAACAGQDESVNTIFTIDNGIYDFDAVIAPGGLPLLLHGNDSLGPIMEVTRCATNDCRFLDPTQTLTTAAVSGALAVTAGGLPTVAFCSGNSLTLATCNDSACAGANETVAILDSVCAPPALAIGIDNLPVISYSPFEPAGRYAKVFHCATASCR